MAKEPPTVRVGALTDQQVAMLAFLGEPEEIGPRRVVSLVEQTPPALAAAAPGICRHVIKDYPCPVVMVLGQPRMVLPNGDLQTVPTR